MKTPVKFKLWKFSLFQALFPLVLFLVFFRSIGDGLPAGVFIGFALFASMLFAFGGAAMAALLLDAVIVNDELKNSFGALGRGAVRLSRARRAFSPDMIFIVLKDEENNAMARIPRPFWADDPNLIRKILGRVEDN